MGVYKGGASYYHSVIENIPKLKNDYEYKNGYFGKEGSSERVRHIECDDIVKTSKDFYDKIAYGGIEEPLENGKGYKTSMEDKTIITYREISSSDGTPAVDINISSLARNSGLKKQKIHFVEVKKDAKK